MNIELKSFKLFTIVLTSTVFIFCVQTGVKSVSLQIFETSDGYQENTSIAGLALQGKVKEQAGEELEDKIFLWKKQNKMNLHYQEKQIELPGSMITFNVDQTMSNIQNGQPNKIDVKIDENELKGFLQNFLGYQIMNILDFAKLENDLKTTASDLSTSRSNIDLTSYMKDKNQILMSTTADISKHQQDIEAFLASGSEILIKANSQFSFNQFIDEKKIVADQQSFSLIASTVYQIILQTNFQIIQRDISLKLPAYAQLGKEVRFEKNLNDFQFKNVNHSDYLIELTKEGSLLRVTLKGVPFANSYQIDTSEQTVIESDKYFTYGLLKSQETTADKMLQNGSSGQTVKVYRNVFDVKGNFMKKQFISEDTYLPINEITIIKKQIEPTIDEPTENSPVENDLSDSTESDTPKTTTENPNENQKTEENSNGQEGEQ